MPAFQNGPQTSGPFFDQNGFNTQYRSNAPDYSRQQIYGNQNDQTYSDGRFGVARQQQASPFRTGNGRSQDATQFYLNQPDYTQNGDTLQRPETYSNKPTSFQYNNHPASSSRPEFSHFAQSSHNHDPSKPETFLGQITINNPFPENPRDIQINRIRQPNHNGFLKSSALDNIDFQQGFPNAPEPVDQDIYDYTEKTKSTTFNPLKTDYASKLKQNRVASNPRPSFYKQEPDLQKKPLDTYFNSNENSFSNTRSRFKPKPLSTTTPHAQTERRNRFSPSTKAPNKAQSFNLRPNKVGFSPHKPHYTPTTEYRPLFDLEPLLEDEIPDTKLFGDTYRSHSNGSEDVQVIKSIEITTQEQPTTQEDIVKTTLKPVVEETTIDEVFTEKVEDVKSNDNSTTEPATSHEEAITTESITEGDETSHDPKEAIETTEYYDDEVEYVDEVDHNKESVPTKTNEPQGDNTFHTDEEEEEEEEVEYEDVQENGDISTPISETFDILTMKPKPVMVKDDNFKGFVDSALIDNTEPPSFVTEQYVEPNQKHTTSVINDQTTDAPAILLGEEVVSVVTTKSVVNGTFRVPDFTSPPQNTVQMTIASETSESTTESQDAKNQNVPNATESWVVVASVQTSRSVSGARFLPFPAVAAAEKKQTLDDTQETSITKNEEEKAAETDTEEYTETTKSTESIIDILDRAQSELSGGFLSGEFKGENKDFAVLTEMPHENVTKYEPTTPTPSIQIFTVKSTTSTSTTERAAPDPLPVTIRKFSPYSRPSPTTPKPKSKAAVFENIKEDDLTGLLPPGFKARSSYKDRKITTTTEKHTEVSEKSVDVPSTLLKSKIEIPSDISAFLPKGYKPPKEEKPFSIDDLFKNSKTNDISHLLPPGFKIENKTETTTEKSAKNNKGSGLFAKGEPVDISALLPKGYKLPTTTTQKPTSQSDLLANEKPIDISAFLPPGFKLDTKKSTSNKTETAPILKNVKFADVSSLLPPGFKSKPEEVKTTEKSTTSSEVPSSPKPKDLIKLVFPSRPGAGKPGKRLTTPRSSNESGGGSGGGVSPPSIHKGWPSR